MTYKKFYQSIGLDDFPFNTFTTEAELEIAKNIFVSQGEYDPILDSFKKGRNIIILGERGSGKTAILEDFKRHLTKSKSTFTIINDFSGVGEVPSNEDIYKLIISNYVVELLATIGEKPLRLLKLNKESRTILSYFLSTFVPSVALNTLKDRISSIQTPPVYKVLKSTYNWFRGPLNFTGTVAQNLTYQYLIKHFSVLPPLEEDGQIQEYFPELKLNVTYDFFDQDISLRLLKKLGEISNKLGLEKPTIFLDRLDEDNRFENDADKISEFISPFLTNTNLLSISEFQMIIYIWTTPFRFISELVRTQKYYCPQLNWRKEDLESLLNQRLSVYSNKKLTNYKTLFKESVSEDELNDIFAISNSNPRDLIHIFKILFEEQFRSQPDDQKISSASISNGLKRYVLDFNYYEYYPRKSNARANSMDVYSYAAHLLKLDTDEFSKNKLNESAGIGSSIHNYVVSMEKIGLIENIGQDKGFATYKIKDPKIVYCLKNGLELRK
ncbi:MAG: shikimate kinase [Salibacteraceae bacterium]|jgi:shikimate kinase